MREGRINGLGRAYTACSNRSPWRERILVLKKAWASSACRPTMLGAFFGPDPALKWMRAQHHGKPPALGAYLNGVR